MSRVFEKMWSVNEGKLLREIVKIIYLVGNYATFALNHLKDTEWYSIWCDIQRVLKALIDNCTVKYIYKCPNVYKQNKYFHCQKLLPVHILNIGDTVHLYQQCSN